MQFSAIVIAVLASCAAAAPILSGSSTSSGATKGDGSSISLGATKSVVGEKGASTVGSSTSYAVGDNSQAYNNNKGEAISKDGSSKSTVEGTAKSETEKGYTTTGATADSGAYGRYATAGQLSSATAESKDSYGNEGKSTSDAASLGVAKKGAVFTTSGTKVTGEGYKAGATAGSTGTAVSTKGDNIVIIESETNGQTKQGDGSGKAVNAAGGFGKVTKETGAVKTFQVGTSEGSGQGSATGKGQYFTLPPYRA